MYQSKTSLGRQRKKINLISHPLRQGKESTAPPMPYDSPVCWEGGGLGVYSDRCIKVPNT